MQQVFLDPASKKPLALVRIGVAPVLKRFCVVQSTLGDLCSLGPRDLSHPPLTTFRDFPFLRQFPSPGFPTTKGTLSSKKNSEGKLEVFATFESALSSVVGGT